MAPPDPSEPSERSEREDVQLRTTAPVDDSEGPKLELDRGVEYERMRGLIESSLFGEPSEPLRIGRFAVLEPVGSGGMGVVYAAYDDVLDRKVAVKVLRGSASEQARERMLREARAMARLSHPNIVTVHEVGEHEGQVFLAMEFVRGQSVGDWIHRQDRAQPQPQPWREVLAVFKQAGRGLAAAHEAGLVHRDFKPHNVVQGEDGTVKVLDFGLAFPTTSSRTDHGEDSEPDSSRSSQELDSITRTGAIVGTPAYMAPEQFRAEPVTPATDQFAFCVSLFEGLYGQRPFAGSRLEALMNAVLDGTITEPPPSSVPAWVRAIVMRGLSPRPEDRFESLPALLEALERDPAVTRRRWLGAAAVVSLTVAGSFGLAALQRPEPVTPCEGAASGLDGVWTPERSEAARAGFLATGVSYADDVWERLRPRLDSYAQEWIEQSTEACRAHEQGRQSEAIFDLRTVCLASRRASLDAVVTLLAQADPGVVEHAVDVQAGLPPIARCADLQALTATVPPPEDPAEAARVAEIRERLASARVQEDAGRFEQAMEQARSAREGADAVGYAPVAAEAALRLGSAWAEVAGVDELPRADEELSEALYTAMGAGHHEVAIEALARRLFVRAELMRLPAERTREDEPLVRALLRRDPGDARVRWIVANNLAVRYVRAGELSQAAALYDEALAEARSRGDDGLRDVTVVLANRALDAIDRDELRPAETDGRAALAIAERLLGPEHPHISFYIYPIATSLMLRGRHAEARTLFERSVAIYERGATSPAVVQDLYLLATIALRRRDYARAQALAERGLEVVGLRDVGSIRLLHARADAKIGQGAAEDGLADHRQAVALAREWVEGVNLASSYEALGEALMRMDALPQAERQLDEGWRLLAEVPDDSAVKIPALRLRAELKVRQGKAEQAAQELTEALAVLEETLAAEHPGLASLRRRLGDAYRAAGRPALARSAYETVLSALMAEHDADHPELADVRLALAQVLQQCAGSGVDCGTVDSADELRVKARALADTAADAYEGLGAEFAAEQQAVRNMRTRLADPIP